ncbi:hypothetical protein EJB05_25609, partial [Eragrostis curvula]
MPSTCAPTALARSAGHPRRRERDEVLEHDVVEDPAERRTWRRTASTGRRGACGVVDGSARVGLVVVSALLLLALTAEAYYIFVHKRRPPSPTWPRLRRPPPASFSSSSASRSRPRSLPPSRSRTRTPESQLMRLGNLVGPPRLLFTIKEETKEDLIESDDGRSRCGRSRSLADLLHCPGTPFLTPASSPAPPPVAAEDNSYNPLFESPMASPGPAPPPAVSPPPKFQFLKDAEEKLYRRALAEEAMRTRTSPSPVAGDEEGGYITIMVGKNNRVIPLPSPPPDGGGHQ